MTEQVIEKIRPAKENEFFFIHHENIGNSTEFKRLMNYINEHSNIRIKQTNIESVDQMRGTSGKFNLVIEDE